MFRLHGKRKGIEAEEQIKR